MLLVHMNVLGEKMKRIYFLLILVFLMGCADDRFATPEETFDVYFDSINSGDVDLFMKCHTSEFAQIYESMPDPIMASGYTNYQDTVTPTISDVKYVGDKVQIYFTIPNDKQVFVPLVGKVPAKGSFGLEFEKIGKEWKVSGSIVVDKEDWV